MNCLKLMIAMTAMVTGATLLGEAVLVTSASATSADTTSRPFMSSDGRYVVFSSAASDLVPGDTNGKEDIFIYDNQEKTTKRVAKVYSGTEPNDWSKNPSISADGRYVVFNSTASNWVANDTNGVWDTFLYDRNTDFVKRITVADGGGQGNQGRFSYMSGALTYTNSDDAQIYPPIASGDGAYVVFASDASNLVANDTNDKYDIFVTNTGTGANQRVSVASNGSQANGSSYQPHMSSDARYIVFNSSATDLVSGDTNSVWDTFIHDRNTGTTERVNVSSDETQANGGSVDMPFVSDDGRYVAFASSASNLVDNDTNGALDVFVRDRQEGTTRRVSVSYDGKQADGASFQPAISADGRYVSFTSQATNLTPNLGSGGTNIYVYDRQNNAVWCVSSASDNATFGNAVSRNAILSPDGGAVSFASTSTNLVATSTNGKYNIYTTRSTPTQFTLGFEISPASSGSTNPANSTSVDVGVATTIKAFPAIDYYFVNWTLKSGTATIADANSATTTIQVYADSVVTANFAHETGSLTLQALDDSTGLASSVGQVTPAGKTTQIINSSIAITAAPATNYHFVRWEVTSGAATIANSTSASTTVSIGGDVTVSARFARDIATLTMAVSGEGTVSPVAGSSVQKTAESLTITATPSSNHHFVKWTVSGSAIVDNTTAASTTITLTGAATVTASFSRDKAKLTMAVSPADAGATTPLVGWVASYDTVTNIPLKAVPNDHYHFVKWTGAGGAVIADSTKAETTAQLTADATITAVFEHDTAVLTIAVSGSGSTSPAVGAHTVDTVTAMTISAVSSTNYHFVNWTVTGGAIVASANSAETTVMLTAAGVVTAVFEHDTAVLTVAVSGSGSTSPAVGAHTVDTVTGMTIKATPEPNYHFVNWTATGGAIVASANSAETTVTLTAAGVVTAVFERDTAVLTMAASGSGSTSPAVGAHTVDTVTGMTIKATPEPNYHFVNWTATGGAIVASANSAETTVTLTAAGVVTAKFAADTVMVALTANPALGGTLDPGIGRYEKNVGDSVTIQATPASGYYFVKWTLVGSGKIADTTASSTTYTVGSDVATITANFASSDIARVTLTSPNGGETWRRGNEVKITWVASSDMTGIALGLFKGDAISATIASGLEKVNSYTWTVPSDLDLGDDYKVSISGVVTKTDGSTELVTDSSDSAFSIVGVEYLQLTAPNGGEVWRYGEIADITWNTGVNSGTVAIGLYASGELVMTISSGTDNDGLFEWTVPDTIDTGNDYTIGIVAVDDTSLSDYSDAAFSISTGVSCVLTLSLTPEDGGQIAPEAGTHTVNAGLPNSLLATPAEGYVFKGWQVVGDAAVDAPESAETSVILNGDAELTALFGIETEREFSVEDILVKFDSSKSEKDRVVIKKATLPDSVTVSDIETGVFKIILGGFTFDGTTEETETKDRANSRNDKIKFQILNEQAKATLDFDLNEDERTWSFDATNIDTFGKIDIRQPVGVYLQVNDKLFGGTVELGQDVSWNFSSGGEIIALTVEGEDMSPFSIDALHASVDEKTDNRDQIHIRKATLGELQEFDPTVDQVELSIDNWEMTFSPDDAKIRRNSVTYQTSETDGPKSTLKLQLKKKRWSFKLNKADLMDYIDGSNGLDVRLVVGPYEGALKVYPSQSGSYFLK